MSDFANRIIKLKNQCLKCWAQEYADIFPQIQNAKVATEELIRNGYPECKCGGKYRLEFQRSCSNEHRQGEGNTE
jgi:hypothetical protein